MRRAVRRPGVLVGSQEPDSVGGEAGGLGGTGNLDRRVARFGREERLIQRAAQLREKIPPTHAAAIEAQRAAALDGLLPAAKGLKLGAGERSCAGKVKLVQQARNQLRPVERGLRAARKLGQEVLGRVMRSTHGAGSSSAAHRWPRKAVKVHCGSFQTGAAQGAHIGLKRGRFLRVAAA